MVRLQVVNTADVAVLSGHFSQPRTPLHVLTGLRVDPDVVDARVPDRDPVNPRQDILTPRLLPAPHIRNRCARGKGIAKVQATLSALPALETASLKFMPGAHWRHCP
jgi:hypothetical protein